MYDTIIALNTLRKIVDSGRLDNSQYYFSFVGSIVTNVQCSEFHVDICV